MSDAEDLDFELITSARMLADPPPLRNKTVTVQSWKTRSGKAARFMVWEMSASEFSEFVESGWTYKDRVRTFYDNADEDFRLLAYTVRDPQGNRLWNKVEDAKVQLRGVGRSDLQLLLNAANEVNGSRDVSSEGNSGETESVS